MNQLILLKNRPSGKPQLSDFQFSQEEKPKISEGEVLLKTRFVSVDPYLRGRMREDKSYIPPFELNQPLSSGIVAEVVESNHTSYNKGDFVMGLLQWKEFQTSNGEGLMKVDGSKAPLSAYLGILGMTGLTAYFGLTEIGKPRGGETLVVSGAAGAVGSVAGQIGKLKGCRVVGIAGTDEKVEMLTSEFGFDAAINYRTTENMGKAIAKACPDGVDVYFDNVGGEISDAVHNHINHFARIVVCGSIAVYNEESIPTGPRVQPFLIKNSALMQGFIVSNYSEKFPGAMEELSKWLAQGRLSYTETVMEGFKSIPQAFIDLFDGKNRGKMVVKVS